MKTQILRNPDPNAGGGGSAGGDGGSGGTANLFIGTLPEDLRADPSLTSFKDVGSLAKSYVAANKMLGSRIPVPDSKADPKLWDEVYNKLGRPETADKYALPQDVKLPEGITLNPEQFKKTQERFHKMGLSTKQAEDVMRLHAEAISEGHASQQAKQVESQKLAQAELTEMFGDKLQAKVELAQAVIKKFGDDKLIEYLNTSGLGNNPQLIAMLAKAGEGLIEDTAGGRLDTQVIGDAGQALGQIGKLKADSEFMKALTTKENPGHDAAVKRWEMLHKQAHGSGSANK